MKRYFFDLRTTDQSLYDYQGDEFLNSQAAGQFAEVMALDLKHRPDGKWAEWSVEVRNAEGQMFFTIPIGIPELLAA